MYNKLFDCFSLKTKIKKLNENQYDILYDYICTNPLATKYLFKRLERLIHSSFTYYLDHENEKQFEQKYVHLFLIVKTGGNSSDPFAPPI